MSEKGHPQRGITFYSYLNLMGRTMTLDDVFEEVADTGATCFELLTSYIEGYPNPSPKWVDHYWSLCEKISSAAGGTRTLGGKSSAPRSGHERRRGGRGAEAGFPAGQSARVQGPAYKDHLRQ